MAKQGNDILIGLNIDDNAIKAVRCVKNADSYQFPNVFSGNLAFPINFETIKNRELIPEISEDVDSLLSKNVVLEGDVALALNRGLVLLKQISVDDDLSDAEILDHVEWELEQFLISSRDEYNVGFEKIARFQDNMHNILMVCVRTTIVDFFKDVFSQTSFSLSTVDVDLFAEAKAIKSLYSDKMDGMSALVSVYPDNISLIVLKDGEILTWSDIPDYNENGYYSDQGEELVDFINSELDAKLKSIGIGRGADNIRVLFLDGNVNISLFSAFQSKYSAEIILVDPSEKTSDDSSDSSPMSENMLAAIGMSISL